MTHLVAEDGTGLSTANGYITTAWTDTYHNDRGNSLWNGYGLEVKERGIIRATDYIDKRFGRKFRGWKKSRAQALEWPRINALDNDGFLLVNEDDVPRQLQKACAEYALRAVMLGVLAPDPIHSVPEQRLEPGAADREPIVSGEIFRSAETIGPISEEKWYQSPARIAAQRPSAVSKSAQSGLVSDTTIPEYPEADMWLEELIVSSMSMDLGRA